MGGKVQHREYRQEHCNNCVWCQKGMVTGAKASAMDLNTSRRNQEQQKSVLLHSDADITIQIFQLDKKMYRPVGSWDSEEHLLQAAGILADRIKAIQRKFPSWSVAQHLKGRPYLWCFL